jgi:hypothetical protein
MTGKALAVAAHRLEHVAAPDSTRSAPTSDADEKQGVSRRWASPVQALGGALIAVGAWLPWLTMFAGLQTYRGIIGLNGRVLLAGGIIVALGGIAGMAGRATTRLSRAVSLAAAVLGGGAVAMLVRLITTWRGLAATDAMMVARPGPGLFVAILGAVLATGALLAIRDER